MTSDMAAVNMAENKMAAVSYCGCVPVRLALRAEMFYFGDANMLFDHVVGQLHHLTTVWEGVLNFIIHFSTDKPVEFDVIDELVESLGITKEQRFPFVTNRHAAVGVKPF